MVDDAAEVADAVAVRVGEAARVDLVDDRLPPPVAVGGHRCRRRRGHATHAIDASERGRGPVREVGGRHTRRRDGAVRSSERAAHLLAALVSGGVREVVLAPGSRSAGLALALYAADAAGDVRLHVRVDERSAGFLALGLAAGSRTPVAVVTTSGTAVGNLLPAVMEASHSGRRLVVLAADRPAAMRGSGANQTTRQDGIFGVFAPCFDLGVDAPPGGARRGGGGRDPAPGTDPSQRPARGTAAARGRALVAPTPPPTSSPPRRPANFSARDDLSADISDFGRDTSSRAEKLAERGRGRAEAGRARLRPGGGRADAGPAGSRGEVLRRGRGSARSARSWSRATTPGRRPGSSPSAPAGRCSRNRRPGHGSAPTRSGPTGCSWAGRSPTRSNASSSSATRPSPGR